MRKLQLVIIVCLVVCGMVASTSAALADKPEAPYGANGEAPFLCPIVGDGVYNADAHNGDHGVTAGTAFAGATFLPGYNQAGAHANPNALNTMGPGASPGPGNGNFDWSPIWPYH